jgi:hypothetical protein
MGGAGIDVGDGQMHFQHCRRMGEDVQQAWQKAIALLRRDEQSLSGFRGASSIVRNGSLVMISPLHSPTQRRVDG